MHIDRHEGRHSVARITFHGNRGELRQPYREGQEDQLAALGFALNVLVLWNTQYMDDAVNHLRRGAREINDEHLARLSPLQHEHVLILGTLPFTLPHELAAGQRRQLRDRDGSPGVILAVTSGTARAPSAGMGNAGSADAGVELLMRTLAAELGPRGVRVVGIHTAAVAETLTRERIAEVSGADVDPAMILQSIAQVTTLRRAPALAHVAATAAFLASDETSPGPS